MYNAEIKDSFIMEMIATKSNRNTAFKIFGITEELERDFGKDIAEMDKAEAESVAGKLDMQSLGTIYTVRSIVNSYLKWCDRNRVFDHVTDWIMTAIDPNSDVFSKAGEIYIKDPASLCTEIKKVREIDNGYVEPPIFALAWIGVGKNSIFNMLDSQVDLANKKIYDVDGSVIASWYSPEISKILTEYADCKIAQRENRTAVFNVVKDQNCKQFLKKFATPKSDRFGESYTPTQLNSALNKIAEAYQELGNPNRLVFKNVWESGRLHALFLLEQAGFDVFSKENASKVTEVFKGTKTAGKALWSYRAYKRYFNLE